MGAIKILQFEEHNEFSIKAITRLPDLLQTRAQTDPRYIKIYSDMKAGGSPFPKVTLFHDIDKSTGTDRFLLADGFTRVAAAEKLGLKTIPATIRVGGIQEALLFGIQRNLSLENIREVTPADRIHAVEMMIRNGAGVPGAGTWDYCDREISRRTRWSMVKQVRLRLEKDEGIPLPDMVKRFNTKTGAVQGKGTPYRLRLENKPINVTSMGARSKGVHVNGQSIRISSDESVANDQVKEISDQYWREKGAVKSSQSLICYLKGRGVFADGVQRSVSHLGGVLVGPAYIYTFETNRNSFLECVGRLVLARHEVPMAGRFIAAGFAAYVTISVHRDAIAATGIEVMTPEEIVAEFAPKPSDA